MAWAFHFGHNVRRFVACTNLSMISNIKNLSGKANFNTNKPSRLSGMKRSPLTVLSEKERGLKHRLHKGQHCWRKRDSRRKKNGFIHS